MKNTYLVTGAAGFIGYHLCKRLLNEGKDVVGVDCLNNYYDVQLKLDRISELKRNNFTFYRSEIEDKSFMCRLFKNHNVNYVCNLAAYANIPYSVQNPYPYIDANIKGFTTILETSRLYPVKNIVYASTSSVYGNPSEPIVDEKMPVNPLAVYPLSKIANEMLAKVYTELYCLKLTGLRFFTVYGPWGRPDMAMFKWVDALYKGKRLIVNNFGNMWRDFTYVDDIVDGIVAALAKPQCNEIYNLGRGEPVKISDVVEYLQKHTGISGTLDLVELPPGEIISSHANVDHAKTDLGYSPKVSVYEGTLNFVNWYKEYYDK